MRTWLAAVIVAVCGVIYAAAMLYRAWNTEIPPSRALMKSWVSDAAKKQTQPEGAKEFHFSVYDFEHIGDDSYSVGGIALITYFDKSEEQRHWKGIAEIRTKGATLRTFELGKIVSPDELADRIDSLVTPRSVYP
jgi:hypothetical protein